MNQQTEVFEPEAVFVDSTGRRRRLGHTLGIIAGCLLTIYIVVVVIGVTSGTGAPFAPWPKAKPSAGTTPRGHRVTPRPLDPRSAASVPARPVARVSGAASSTSPRPRTTGPATSAPVPHASQASKGHAYGRTKSPHPRKP